MGRNSILNITIPMDELDYQPPNFTKDQWSHYMKEKINLPLDDTPMANEKWMILKPPQALMEVKPQSYKPKLVTIGPLYQNLEPSLINNFKALCVKKFMERNGISAVEDLIQHLIFAQSHELSHIYNIKPPQYHIEWLQLLVTVDTVFIHEFLRFLSKIKSPECHCSQILSKIKSPECHCSYFHIFYSNDLTLRVGIQRDLLLIGNQIPMSLLAKISNTSKFPFDVELTVRTFIMNINPFFYSEDGRKRFSELLESKQIKLVDTCEHLLDSLYYSCTASKEEEPKEKPNSCFSILSNLRMCRKTEKEYVRLPPASRLYEAGIRFKACEGNISEMKYDKKKLWLHVPRLVVFDRTEDLLRNLIAHELTSGKGDEFSMYAVIMDSLIDTPDDLAILKKYKIIENHMGNDERFVDMWNNMCINVPYNDKSERWKQMIDEIVAHHSSHRRRWYAEFYKRFLSRPWLTISFIAAFLLLLATIYQAAYSGIGYYKPKN